MIVKMAVLFRVQYLQKSCRHISLIVTAGLVDLIQKHQRISHSRLLQGLRNPSRHRTDIGASVSTYLCLIADTSKTDSHILFIQCPGHRTGNGCFSSSRRSYQTEYRTFPFLCEIPDSQKLHDPLFDLFQSIMIFFQYLESCLQIIGVFRLTVPRHIQQCTDIVPRHISLSIIVADRFESLNLLADSLFDFRRRIQKLKPLPELLCL